MTTINNLTKHDSPEFKVGDKIVMIKSYAYDDVREIKEFCDSGKVCITTDGRKLRLSLSSGYMVHRHATPAEIKAGHRIDDTTDHVTDIRNHVSPNTRVVDL